MRGVVKKWGRSVAVRVPTSILKEARLSIGQAVDLRVEHGRIIIESIPTFGLEGMLARVTRQNLHEEVNFGVPVGREAP